MTISGSFFFEDFLTLYSTEDRDLHLSIRYSSITSQPLMMNVNIEHNSEQIKTTIITGKYTVCEMCRIHCL